MMAGYTPASRSWNPKSQCRFSVPLGTSVGAAVVLCAAVCYAAALLLSRLLRLRDVAAAGCAT